MKEEEGKKGGREEDTRRQRTSHTTMQGPIKKGYHVLSLDALPVLTEEGGVEVADESRSLIPNADAPRRSASRSIFREDPAGKNEQPSLNFV